MLFAGGAKGKFVITCGLDVNYHLKGVKK
jgi:hypothetical protein